MVRDLERSNIVLKPNQLTMEQDAEMTLFYMNAWGLDYRNSSIPADGSNIVAKCQFFTQTFFDPQECMLTNLALTVFIIQISNKDFD